MMKKTESVNSGTRLKLISPVSVSFLFYNLEVHLALLHLFERNACRLMFERVNLNAWSRAALNLFASFGGDDNHAVF